MSKWQDYGYPDLVGVPFQTALEGLVLAARERAHAETIQQLDTWNIFKIFESGEIYPFHLALRDMENLFQNMRMFVLPDGSIFTPENAAAFLNEELVADITTPLSAATFEWFLQRYRFLNLIHTVSVNYQMPITNLYAVWQGDGKTFSDAHANLKEEIKETISSQISAYIETGKFDNYCTIRKVLSAPKSVTYRYNVPGVLYFAGIPKMPSVASTGYSWPDDAESFTVTPDSQSRIRWYWDQLTSDLVCGKRQVCCLFKIPEDIKTGTVLSISEPVEKLFNHIKNNSFFPPSSGYLNDRCFRGFHVNGSWYCDFSSQLEFNDPVGPG